MGHASFKRRKLAARRIKEKYGFYPAWPVIEALYFDEINYQDLPKKKSFVALGKFFKRSEPAVRECGYQLFKILYDKPEKLAAYLEAGEYRKKELMQELKVHTWDMESNLREIRFILSHKKHWVRSIHDFELECCSYANRLYKWHELLMHLFAKYKVSRLFTTLSSLTKPYHMQWFLHLAQGGSLRTAPNFPYKMSAKEMHIFMEVSHVNSIEEAFWYSKCRVAGMSVTMANEALKYCIRYQIVDNPFWNSVLRFIGFHFKDSTISVATVLAYIRFQVSENKGFSLKGKTGKSIMNGIKEFESIVEKHWNAGKADQMRNCFTNRSPINNFEEMLAYYYMYVKGWPGVDLPDYAIKRNEKNYQLKQIKKMDELQEEGKKMSHCVGSYGSRCAKGSCAIWSLREQTPEGIQRLLTIEMREGKLVQIRGYRNRVATTEEKEILTLWSNKMNLVVVG